MFTVHCSPYAVHLIKRKKAKGVFVVVVLTGNSQFMFSCLLPFVFTLSLYILKMVLAAGPAGWLFSGLSVGSVSVLLPVAVRCWL